MARIIGLFVLGVGWIGFFATILAPMVSYLVDAFGQRSTVNDSWWLSSRQWRLLGRTVLMAGAGTLVALIVSLAGVLAWGRKSALSHSTLLVVMLFLPLLVPPMILAFGWQRILGGYWFRDLSPIFRTVWVWATWGWPIAVLIMSAGWNRVGSGAYEAALLVAGRRTAFVRGALPALRRHILASGVILFVLFVSDYGVPHANGVFVMASEMMDTAGESNLQEVVVRLVRISWPLLLVVVGAMVLLGCLWGGSASAEPEVRRIEWRVDRWASALVVIAVVVCVVLPVTAVAGRSTILSDASEALSTYGFELMGSVLICAVVGILATLIGVSLSFGRLSAAIGLIGTLLVGLLPGAIAGTAVLSAYKPRDWMVSFPVLESTLWYVYSQWPILVIGLTCRFAWVGCLVGRLVVRTAARSSTESATLDGGGGTVDHLGAQVWHHWPLLMCGCSAIFAMALAEFAMVGLLRVPSPTMMAMIVIEKFHRFEYGMLSALCGFLVVGVVPSIVLLWLAIKRLDARV